MKIFCSFCGVHFPQDFEKTLQSPCNFWGEHNLTNLPIDLKKKLWDWAFTFPADEIWIVSKLALMFDFKAIPMQGKTFEEIVTNWASMTEEEKQQFERDWFNKKVGYNGLPINYGPENPRKPQNG